MIIDVTTEKMVVISDLHLGNPFSSSKKQLIEFLYWAAENKYDVCINGDGLEIAQVSFRKLAEDVPEVFRAVKAISRAGNRVFYIVGNHDILLENFLEDWGSLILAPFLNVRCGSQRIRIEHGHLYDPFFVKRPDLYEFLTWLGGFVLMVSPRAYKAWIKFEEWKSRVRRILTVKSEVETLPGEHPDFVIAAEEICSRGFDAIIFGHTHHAGELPLPQGRYFNSGSWLIHPNFINIQETSVEVKSFSSGLFQPENNFSNKAFPK
ncbi:UDP-2,3-diacylglucosamine diphosphatase [Bdellovibrio sp. 22V]|uniref:UDP-2,3-diacylglucosamine diphosphatase n=1 Tax=Bdellovibrio TaxID=958 RepID=UPI002542FB80|nr:UDP-2,3-diacylglucosamine diphosphatase [Bdellovibrio sp. 22V]WII73093.1 UDP-2,3-diacylglucosamine diphosphatase [Bdellovibrio sp. 22V]